MEMDINQIRDIIPHRYPFILVDRILEIEDGHRVVGIKNVTINEPFFQGHFPEQPIMPGVLIPEAMAQTSCCLLLRNSEYAGRLAMFVGMEEVKFRRPVVPGDQLRMEMEVIKQKRNFVKMKGIALVDGKVVCEGVFLYTLAEKPSKPQISPTAHVHPSVILGKDVTVGPNCILGENVTIGDRTVLEANVQVAKWTKIGEDCHFYFGCVIGSEPQDVKYQGEKSWVVIGDRNKIREYVTINRATGKDCVTEIGSDNLFLTQVHIGHNCIVGNNVIISNMSGIAGHVTIQDNAIIGGMTGIHQFVKVGTGSFVGAYTKLIKDLPPHMLCEGTPAVIKGLNIIGLRRKGVARTTIAEMKDIYKEIFRSGKNTSQAIETLETQEFQSEEANKILHFIKNESDRGIIKKAEESIIEEENE
jgi:UDP-N-acetylglucosamine acyltransferase